MLLFLVLWDDEPTANFLPLLHLVLLIFWRCVSYLRLELFRVLRYPLKVQQCIPWTTYRLLHYLFLSDYSYAK